METLENTNEAVTKTDLRLRGNAPMPPSGYAPEWERHPPRPRPIPILQPCACLCCVYGYCWSDFTEL